MEKKTVHLVVTPFCNRRCKYCCNKKYDIQNLPVVTKEELKSAEMLCLTGGEPFAYTKPVAIANYYHKINPDIPIIVYTNASELFTYLCCEHPKNLILQNRLFARSGITGLNICIKNKDDILAIWSLSNRGYFETPTASLLPMTRIIVMEDMWKSFSKFNDEKEFSISDSITIINRPWQKDFEPAPDCLFRRI